MPDMKLRVGLVGLGTAWEGKHRPTLRALSDRFEVRAVYEEVWVRAQQIAHDFGATAMDGFRALAARRDIDAILMLSPQWFGPMPIFAACDEGKAVYCAATMDLDVDQAREIKLRVEQSGIAFMAARPRRLAPATLRLKELIATRLGSPRLLFCHQRIVVPEENPAAQHEWQTSPVRRDLGELVDWCRYIVGEEPTSVLGVTHGGPPSSEAVDYQMMSLDFSPRDAPGTGPLAQISCGRYVPASWREAVTFRPPAALQVSCEQGIAFVDLPSNLIWFDEAGRHLESLESERPVGEQLLSQFHRSVTSLVRRTSDLEDAFRALAIVLAACKSCETSRRLDLEF
jgi:predicted dehydrogenase